MKNDVIQDLPCYNTTVPACYSLPLAIDGNPIRQVLVREQHGALRERSGRPHQVQLEDGQAIRVARRRPKLGDGERALVLRKSEQPEELRLEWVSDLQIAEPSNVVRLLAGSFRFLEADPLSNRDGLRKPQLGAVHAVLGFWSTNPSEPGIVVMPTGTGKTETMLALLAAEQLDRLLVIVPTDALRSQITEKFEAFGILQRFGVIDPSAPRPVVGQVKHKFSDRANAERFANACNVVVATPSALFAPSPEVLQALIACCSHLFVAEAHHVPARTWRQILDTFDGRPVVQFTATPFREDGRPLGGRMIYNFPLREAQRQNYFSRREGYSPICERGHILAASVTVKLRSTLGTLARVSGTRPLCVRLIKSNYRS